MHYMFIIFNNNAVFSIKFLQTSEHSTSKFVDDFERIFCGYLIQISRRAISLDDRSLFELPCDDFQQVSDSFALNHKT